MTMTFSLHENFEFSGVESRCDSVSTSIIHHQTEENYLFAGKLKVPKVNKYIQRPRLDEILTKSVEKFGTTLITGRTGTGKTSLAANFALNYRKTAWFSIDSADADWKTFSRYFSANIENLATRKKNVSKIAAKAFHQKDISQFIEGKMTEISFAKNTKPSLIVLDDLHHIFDAKWFEDFFMTLVHSLLPKIHLLMLSRGTPALPLWRLRSKQVLGVIDEKLLAFNLKETNELFEKFSCPPENAAQAFAKSFGRISRLRSLVEKI